MTQRVAERISNVTRAPVRYMEPFQILKYEVGQFYKTFVAAARARPLAPLRARGVGAGVQARRVLTRPRVRRGRHHDQNSGLFTPQGVRVYTFFMYLSTPEAGGGTRFDNLDVVVPAVKGNAVMWPSVTDADPTQDEPHTFHQGLPPERGVKYAANVWVHNVRDQSLLAPAPHPPRPPSSASPVLAAVRLSDTRGQWLPAHAQEHALIVERS